MIRITPAHPCPDSQSIGHPLVSIILLVFRNSRQLVHVIESAWKQTYRPLEVLVVICDDETRHTEIISTSYPNIQVLWYPGEDPIRARSMAVQQSRGDYLMFLSPDSLLHPASVQLSVDVLKTDPQCAVAGAIITAPQNEEQPASVSSYALLRHCAQMPPAAVFRRSVALPLPGANPALRLAEDNVLFAHFAHQYRVSCAIQIPHSPPVDTEIVQRQLALARLAWDYSPWAVVLRQVQTRYHRLRHTGTTAKCIIGCRRSISASPFAQLYQVYRILGYRHRKRRPLPPHLRQLYVAPRPILPQRYYLICASARTGSNLLGELLARSGVAGRPFEIFNCCSEHYPWHWWQQPEAAEHLHRHTAHFTTDNRVCGIKLMYWQVLDLLAHLHSRPGYQGRAASEVFNAIFWNPRYIWLRRHDKVRQVVSLWKALQTSSWHSFWEPQGRPVFDRQAIADLSCQIQQWEDSWQQFFAEGGIEPLMLFYEDLVADPIVTLRTVLAYLDLPDIDEGLVQQTVRQQQSDAISEEWVQMYYDSRAGTDR